MNRRLQQFLTAENISQSQFADTIGVARASVSHILAGRNKPGFDFIQSMSRHYPDLNLEWLITGKGRMYNGVSSLFDEYGGGGPDNNPAEETPEYPRQTQKRTGTAALPQTVGNASWSGTQEDAAVVQTGEKQRNITSIIVFYDDNTYQELK